MAKKTVKKTSKRKIPAKKTAQVAKRKTATKKPSPISVPHPVKLSGPTQNSSLLELMQENLSDVFCAEKHLEAILPSLIQMALHEGLRNILKDLLIHMKEQNRILFNLMKRADVPHSEDSQCPPVEILVNTLREKMNQMDKNPIRDAAMICTLQKLVHYQMAAYLSLAELADALGYHRMADSLDRILAGAEESDIILYRISRRINTME
ncbi:MAG TPA: DUF892 family protein [Bacteroidia bacterium]|jgi:ferritin-like metal-binding protein YciE|nr:DUF892 family protein [Bacteroidia bacterium]